ncbi:hypothetical protein ACF0H5_018301 [Mactra antiquata]
MFQFLRRPKEAKMPLSSEDSDSSMTKPVSAITIPGMYLFYKYSEFKRQQQESHRKKVTEKELDHLNHKIATKATMKQLKISAILSLKCPYL